MPSISPGRICVKVAGRDAGRYCVATSSVDNGFVEITGPKSVSGVKRRRCNASHLEPTESEIEIPEKAKDEDVLKALKSAGLEDGMKKRIALCD